MYKVKGNDIKLVQTCGACPEQYDALYKNKIVGYLRLRHSVFTVECPICGGEEVFYAQVDDDGWTGIFDSNERDGYLRIAKCKIAAWLNRGNV